MRPAAIGIHRNSMIPTCRHTACGRRRRVLQGDWRVAGELPSPLYTFLIMYGLMAWEVGGHGDVHGGGPALVGPVAGLAM